MSDTSSLVISSIACRASVIFTHTRICGDVDEVIFLCAGIQHLDANIELGQASVNSMHHSGHVRPDSSLIAMSLLKCEDALRNTTSVLQSEGYLQEHARKHSV